MYRSLIFSFFIVLFMLSSLTAQVDVFKKQHQQKIKALNIKTETKYNHPYANNQPKEKGYKNVFKKYDTNGNLLKKIEYDSKGNTMSKEIYEYDEDNLVSEYKRIDVKKDKMVYKKDYFYNPYNQKKRERGYNGTGHFTNKYVYNQEGKLKNILYHSGDQLIEKRTFYYQNNSEKIKVIDPDDNSIKSQIIKHFDQNDNLIKRVKLNAEGKKILRYLFKYREDNKLTKKTKYERGQFKYSLFYTYNNKKELIRIAKELPEKEEPYTIRKIKYTNSGEIKEEQYRDDPEEPFSKKAISYNENGLCSSIDWFYATYDYHTLFKYHYTAY